MSNNDQNGPHNELSWHAWIEKSSSTPTNSLIKRGIGDDAAWLGETQNLVTSDMLVEGRHFETNHTTPERIGRKALAVSLSDCAAMAAKPYAAFISLAIPHSTYPSSFLRRLWTGLTDIADEYQVELAGGDTNSWDQGLVISVTVLASPHQRGPVFRSGARPQDVVCVTGSLGGSIHGKHLDFKPRVFEAQWLADHFPIHAMIDVSDGLAADLPRLAKASGVGVLIKANNLPVSRHLKDLTKEQQLHHALGDGEDFELLFSLPEDKALQLVAQQPFPDCPISSIGKITSTKELLVDVNGSQKPMPRGGFVHQL